jgi:uncharacterized membrane protein (DUF485 family)
MPHELAFTALGFALILFLVVLVLVVLLIAQAQEYRLGHSFGGAFTFAIVIIGLCALVALGMISTKVPKTKSVSTLLDRG